MRIVLASLMIVATASSAASEGAPWSAVRAESIRAHVEFLADDLLEGRAAASRGYDLAAAYAAAQFRANGLTPAGENESFYQTVPLLEATPVLPGSSVELVTEEETHSFEYGTDYLPSADYTAASSTVTAPLAFAGFGVEAPALGHDDFTHVDLKGRIAVIFSGAPASFPHDQRAYHSWTGRKFAMLIAKGAVGAVIVDSPDDLRRVPWERHVAMSWVPQMRWLDEAGQPQDSYAQLKLRFRFNHAAAEQLFANAERSFKEALASAEAGEPQGFELPGLLTLSATTGLRHTQSRNVLGVLPGADPDLRGEFVVLTAHLDHLGRGSAVGGDSIYNGAHDNALGAAILLEMARAVRASGMRPRRSLLFALVTAEEKGLLGSDYLAQHPPAGANALVANINIDMPLLLVPTADFVGIGTEHSTLGALARRAVAAQGYQLTPDLAPEEVAFIRSDQFSFVRRGIPSILLSGGNRAQDAAIDVPELKREFLRMKYHQPGDDGTVEMDFAGAADLARVNLRIALEIANGGTAAQWKPEDFFGTTFGRKAADEDSDEAP